MTYFMDSYGCAKNQVDAENMMALLGREGWICAESADEADIVIINSCGFIESAKQESINAVLSWRNLYPKKKILLAGCLAQRYAKDLSESLPEADGFFGTDDLNGIARALEQIFNFPAGSKPGAGETSVRQVPPECTEHVPHEFSGKVARSGKILPGNRPLLSMPGSAYVKISEGCDNRCSYCAIPLIRGNLKSRSMEEILSECKTLLKRGIRELCLVAQDSGSFGKDRINIPAGKAPVSAVHYPYSLYGLLEALSGLKGNFRIRLLYIHPDHFPMPILDMMEKDERILPYFDIPFQHGSEKILNLMNRSGNARIYLDLIMTIRKRLPDAVIRSTFMTGFPGETEEDFEELLDFQKKARLDWLGCFAYSREENTPAFDMKGRVPKKTAAARKRIIEERQVPITEKQMDRFVGRAFDVLVEEKFEAIGGQSSAPAKKSSRNDEEGGKSSLYLGRLPFQAPEVDGTAVIFSSKPLKLGAKVPCKITARAGFDLKVLVE